MLEALWTVTKAFGRFLKIHAANFLIIGLVFYTFNTVNEINKEIYLIERQNLQAYNVQAEVNGKIVTAINLIAEYVQQAEAVNVQRLETLAQFLTDLDTKIKAADDAAKAEADASLNRDKIIASHIEASEQKPAYDYMKSMVVYLVETYAEADMMSIGTGTVIKVTDTETFILTNKHVCDFAEGSTCFVYQDKEKYVISLVKKSEVDHDMQVVKTSVVVPNKQAVKGIKNVVAQDKVFMVGNNNGNPFMYSEGTVSGFMRQTGDLLVGMPSGPGNSGSGIFTQDGYLTGLLYAGQLFPAEPFGSAMDTAHGICINSEVLKLFLSDYLG